MKEKKLSTKQENAQKRSHDGEVSLVAGQRAHTFKTIMGKCRDARSKT